MMPGDGPVGEGAHEDAADIAYEMRLSMADAWIRNSGWSAAFGLVLADEFGAFSPDMDIIIDAHLSRFGKTALRRWLAGEIVDTQGAFVDDLVADR